MLLPTYEKAGMLSGDVAGQILLETDARRSGLMIDRNFTDGVLRFGFDVDVPASNETRRVRVAFPPKRNDPAVHIDGPLCLRHRWGDNSLCMWDPKGPPEERWLVGDGLPELAAHIGVHAYCEAECRAGNPWPKQEMAGEHPRKRDCPSCRGRGR